MRATATGLMVVVLAAAVACGTDEFSAGAGSTSRETKAPAPATSSAAAGASSAAPPKGSASPASAAPAVHAAPDAAAAATPNSLLASAPEAGPWIPARTEPLTDAPRVYAKSRFVWVWPRPSSEGQWIGYLWTGGSVKLRDEKPHAGPGCNTWYAIEPRGFVCVDGKRATLDPQDPGYRAALPYAARLNSPWPHRYGESRDLRRYVEVPTPEQQRQREGDLTAQLARIERARSGTRAALLEGVDLTEATGAPFGLPGLPPSVHEPRDRLGARSTIAYTTEALAHNRSFLLSADLMWVPKDRVAPYPQVQFRGVRLDERTHLPLAFFRRSQRPKYRMHGGDLVATGEFFERLSHVLLTGKSLEKEGVTYLEIRESGLWVNKNDAVVPEPKQQTPWGAPVGGPDTEIGPRGRRTWMEISIVGGWLVAFEGTRPVFVTLMSPGKGGPPHPGKELLETSSSPVGRFTINGKFATATMVAPGELVHSDVPWTQNFSGPYALHTAYWHDDWGYPKSGGCINVSPIDGQWLYQWTDPQAPAGWHGVRWLPDLEPATQVVIHP